MGAVTFGVPLDLARTLVRAGGLRSAVETGTYLGDSALALRKLVPRVWTVELLPDIHRQAAERIGTRSDITLLLGYSPDVLAGIATDVEGPTLFWLDGHGGTFGGNDVPSGFKECPVLDELGAIDQFPQSEQACILIDDARAFFGPMLQHNPEEWPTFLELATRLTRTADRYVTVLDDVVIAVPSTLRPVVDDWWRDKLRERDGLEALQYQLRQEREPSRRVAFKKFLRAMAPPAVRRAWTRWRTRSTPSR